jgi:hypothetical protein
MKLPAFRLNEWMMIPLLCSALVRWQSDVTYGICHKVRIGETPAAVRG